MDMTTAILFLVGGFALLLVGGESLVRAAISIAVRTNIPPVIISLTIVAAGTSAPELVTSLIAALKGKPDIAVGNVAGSNIFNILAILGLSFLIKPALVRSSGLAFEWLTLVLFTAITWFFITDLRMVQWEGAVLLTGFVATIVISIRQARKKGYDQNDDPEGEEDIVALSHPLYDLGFLIVGMGSLVGGAQLALEGGVFVGEWFGLSEKVIGVTIVSVGTGLPELATSAVAAFRGRSDIAIGNVVGSNIMNTLGVLGATAVITPLSISQQILSVDIWVMLGVTVFMWPTLHGIRIALNRFGGFVYLTLYIAYVVATLKNWAF